MVRELSYDGVEERPSTSPGELCGWYMYDFANSPYFQVYICGLITYQLKWLAEAYAGKAIGLDVFDPGAVRAAAVTPGNLNMPAFGITAASYPSLVGWINTVVQLLVVLTFAALGDYGSKRKELLQKLTYAGAFFVFLNVFCFSGSTWWLASLLRIFAGTCFVLCTAYYNAYLPLLVASHPDVTELPPNSGERLEAELQISDSVSMKGMVVGMCGGLLMMVAVFFVLKWTECDKNTIVCTETAALFPISACIAAVGVWWAAFATFTFTKLRVRPGPPTPKGVNLFRLGWTEAASCFRYMCSHASMCIFCMAYLFFSDGVSTVVGVSVLLLENGEGGVEGTASQSMIMLMLAVVGNIVGGLMVGGVQKQFPAFTAKGMLMFQLIVFALVSVAGGLGAIGSFGMIPVLAPICFFLTSLQAFSRSIFSSLIPKGQESMFFAFYEITDKGSNLIGPLVIIIVHNTTHSYLGVFWYLAFAFVLSAVLLFFLDVDQGMADAGKIEWASDEESEARPLGGRE